MPQPLPPPILGIHHVTAIASDPQRNLDFYAGVLGLRLVKRTVNFDDPSSYHFYFGDETGTPGTILTFFAWPGARRGAPGVGQVEAAAFRVPAASLGYWERRLRAAHVPVEPATPRFGETALSFADPDGLRLELVAAPAAAAGAGRAWRPVPPEHALGGFHAVTLSEAAGAATAGVLEAMGFGQTGEQHNRSRFALGAAGAAARLDVVAGGEARFGRIAAGIVHHVAWRVADDAAQLAWRARLLQLGLHVTPVLDRCYFHSIYFREPGGVLFEIATDPPGFTVDEPAARLGEALQLPPWLEPDRAQIESSLPPVAMPRPEPPA